MTDTPKSEIERAAADLADGKKLDWERLKRAGSLSAEELAALEVLEQVQLGPPSEQAFEDGFEIRGELGQGSMGHVYRAYDRSLRREVALKVVAPGRGMKPNARANFLAEARLLASVRHPAIVQVYSVHEHEGEIRMALELVEGRTLEEIVTADGPLSPAEAARVGSELCRALAVLHERGIIHRDLKPANVMREKGGRIVLLDFGIARSPSSSGPLASGAAGTPRFMAPEQFGSGQVGPQADLWALGALLYWLVSARFPFEGATYEELAGNVLAGRPIPLVDRRGDVDARFASIVARALERDLRDRHRTAGELEQELRTLALPTDAVQRRPATKDEDAARKPAPRTRPWRGPMSVVLAVVVLGLAAALWIQFGKKPAALHLDTELYARRGEQDVRLNNGDVISAGDSLFLEASSPEPFHVYVFNQDDTGEMHVLFPVPGFEPANPLAAGAVHRLPGSFRGEAQCWVVTSGGGGGENVLIVAAREPMPAMQELLARIPPVQPGESPAYPALPSETRTALLRGIGATTTLTEPTTTPATKRVSSELELGAILERLDPAPGFFIRMLRLQNR